MRRFLTIASALVVVVVVATPAAGAAPSRNVQGTLTGPGGFRFAGCGIIIEFGSGTYTASALGSGTYSFEVCISGTSPFTFSGTATFTSRNGARLDGVVDGTGTGPTFPVTITGGTKQFSHATGSLVIGPLVQSNHTNCNPRVLICLNWTDNGPIAGTLQHVPRR